MENNANTMVGSKITDPHLRNAINLKHNINKNVLSHLMGSKTKVLNFEENIYNYNNYVINNYNQNITTSRPSTSNSSKQINNTNMNMVSSISNSKLEVNTNNNSNINNNPIPIHHKKYSSSNVNNLLGSAHLNESNLINSNSNSNINHINSINSQRYIINISKDDCNSNNLKELKIKDSNIPYNFNNNSSSSNIIQSIKSKQIPMPRDRDRRSNSIFGMSVLNNKPSTANLHKNPTIKSIRGLNSEIMGHSNSNSRCGSINKIDSLCINDRSPSKNSFNIDNLKISRKLNGKSTSSISSLASTKSPVYLYKNNSSITNSSTGSSMGNNNSLKYNKQL